MRFNVFGAAEDPANDQAVIAGVNPWRESSIRIVVPSDPKE
jgi:hypothetical protein